MTARRLAGWSVDAGLTRRARLCPDTVLRRLTAQRCPLAGSSLNESQTQVRSERADTCSWAWVPAVPVVTLHVTWRGVGTPDKSMELGGQEKKNTVSLGGRSWKNPQCDE